MSVQDRILAVDDDPVSIDILKESFAGQWDLKVAYSGEEALDIAGRFNPNIILLDVMMPGIDGYEMCQIIKKDPKLRFTKVIIVSAKAMMTERLTGYTVGADDYITKPFDVFELSAKIKVFQRLRFVEEMEQLKNNLLRLLAHELRTPLNGILGYVPILRQSSRLGEEERAHLQVIEDCGNELLDFSKKVSLLCELKDGRVLRMKGHLLEEIVVSIIEKLRNKAVNAHVSFFYKSRLHAKIVCDPVLIERALTFIIENAIKFSPRGGTVSILLDQVPDRCLISIQDQGEGIEESRMNEIFSEFSVGNIMHHQAGQGLSLAIARTIARLHGGDLLARNNSAGGALFIFAIPFREEKWNPPPS